jgi:hypothetical protein
MRPSNKSRSRNKPSNGAQNQRRSVGNIINRVFDSAGPDGKVRGTPQQIIDKYNVLARDAQLSGDRVAAESFLQHAEHYSRLLGEAQRQAQEQRQVQDQRHSQEQRDPGRREDAPQQRRSNGAESEGSEGPDESALATYDTGGSDDASGPVDTPEDRQNAHRAAQRSVPDRRDATAHRRSEEDAEPVDEAPDAGGDEGDLPSTPPASADRPASEESGEVGAEDKPAPKKRTRRKPRPKTAGADEAGRSDGEAGASTSTAPDTAPAEQTEPVEQ